MRHDYRHVTSIRKDKVPCHLPYEETLRCYNIAYFQKDQVCPLANNATARATPCP